MISFNLVKKHDYFQAFHPLETVQDELPVYTFICPGMTTRRSDQWLFMSHPKDKDKVGESAVLEGNPDPLE